MNIGILVNNGESTVKNIGDYIQSLIQTKFAPKFECYIEREKLDEFHSDKKIKLIMNGWFMRHPEKFPPSNDIVPLFISFHVSPKIERDFFSENTIAYLKSHAPIGCRDTGTLAMMESRGINAYFSGCLTLCFGEFYNHKKSDKVYFVDPYYEYGPGAKGKMKHLRSLFLVVKHYRKLTKFINRFRPEFYGMFYKISPKLNMWTMAASFYETYRNFFGDKIFENAEFINHQINQVDYPTNEDKMELAKNLMLKYSQAGLVITSRIHCALPCLGVETPVFFITSESICDGVLRSGGRLGGLIDLLNTLKWTEKGIIPISENCKKITAMMSVDNAKALGNPQRYNILKNRMVSDVQEFLSK